MNTRRTSAFSSIMVAIPLLLVALAGCANPSPPAPAGSPSPSASEASFDDYDLAFAQCMRDQGVEMPDPDDGGSSAPAANDPAFGAAIEACVSELGPEPAGSESPTDADDQYEIDLLLSACLRANGIDVPDPQPGERISLPMDVARETVQECMTEAEAGVN